jgi:hypothetical protein
MNQQALDTAQLLYPDLWSIQNLLSNDELGEILNRISHETLWEFVDLQEHTSRKMVAWQTDGLCDWVFCKLSELDFSRFGLLLRTVTIWKDSDGYFIKDHNDNSRVVAAMQIYLSDSCSGLGTWFADDIEIPFVQNTGYLMHNRNKLKHGMKNPVTGGYTRLSFYALFDEITT